MMDFTVSHGSLSKSDYSIGMLFDVICVSDLDCGGISVTDNAENVVREIKTLGYDTLRYPILLRDTMGNWHEIVTENGEFKGFKPMGQKVLKDALLLLFEEQCAEAGLLGNMEKRRLGIESSGGKHTYEKFESEL